MAIDSSARVARTAKVQRAAQIGPGVRVGDYCVIESDVTIGRDCVLEPYVYVKRWTTLGERNSISAGTVLGSDPLDKNFTGHRSYLRIGDGNVIREHYTISRGTEPESVTETLGAILKDRDDVNRLAGERADTIVDELTGMTRDQLRQSSGPIAQRIEKELVPR